MDAKLREPRAAWHLPSSRFTIEAISPRTIVSGHGSASTLALAQRRALMELVERYAQFHCHKLSPALVASYDSIRDQAIDPRELGLYNSAQYHYPEFPFASFSTSTPIEWIEVHDLRTGTSRLVPLEFIYPNAPVTRRRIVGETSSGTAAHTDRDCALVAGLCEVIERDTLTLFWYRQPRTPVISVASIQNPVLRDELVSIQELGYVLVICDLTYDLGISVFLILAIRRGKLAHGIGCHPTATRALEHAIRELGGMIGRLEIGREELVLYHAVEAVHAPLDHLQLYGSGPMLDLLRQVLSYTLYPMSNEEVIEKFNSRIQNGSELEHVLDVLECRGYRSYATDIVPAELQAAGIHVVRVLVPGLIPMHFGANFLRLGSNRLIGVKAPGRFRTVMPHFFS